MSGNSDTSFGHFIYLVGQYLALITPVVFISQFCMFIFFLFNGRNATIDVAWVLNHFLIGLAIATSSFTNFHSLSVNDKEIISIIILGIWAIRLGGHLFINRVWKAHTDPRYVMIMSRGGERYVFWKFLFQYLLQGILVIICSIPLYFVFDHRRGIGYLQIIGWIIASIGIIGSGIADYELEKFKALGMKGKILREGLWKHSRHPNLFFELITWFGFALVGVKDLIDCIGFIGPIFLWFVMSKLTIPLTEKSMSQSRPNWDEYVRETNKYWIF